MSATEYARLREAEARVTRVEALSDQLARMIEAARRDGWDDGYEAGWADRSDRAARQTPAAPSHHFPPPNPGRYSKRTNKRPPASDA